MNAHLLATAMIAMSGFPPMMIQGRKPIHTEAETKALAVRDAKILENKLSNPSRRWLKRQLGKKRK